MTNDNATHEFERFLQSIGRLLAVSGTDATGLDDFVQRHALGERPAVLIQSGWADALNHLRAREQGRAH